MKGKLKSLLLTVCLLVSMSVLAACGQKTESTENNGGLTEQEITSFESSAVGMIESVTAMDDATMEQYLTMNDEFTTGAIQSWKDAKEELGAYKESAEQSYEVKGKVITITTKAIFENMDADVELTVDFSNKSSVSATGMTFNIDYPMSVMMERAALNTVMGIVIVFLMLLFLSFLISLFKYIPKLTESFGKKKEITEEPKAPVAVEIPTVQEEEELVDDGELVAVIAAAIAASENTSTDGFVVRSIKKANRKKWQKA